MEEFKTNYTGEFGEGATLQHIGGIQQGLGNRILKFSKPYTKKIEIIGDLIPKKPGNEDYITTDHFESF